jgi:hypothetical protein
LLLLLLLMMMVRWRRRRRITLSFLYQRAGKKYWVFGTI